MTLYKARKDNIEFYIQPEMIEAYAAMGYVVIKLDERILTDEEMKSEITLGERNIGSAGGRNE
ncbi:hypothetical protein C3B58_01245 [Lactonifactor longoviformis]|uniref:Uncharacterized protein n=1 Tax=Lactonifactor longoviformis DSM 17459 TaxID=1122155 RepID=A0A1M4VX98_9CLOT|nr:hypothetical protein [Lactonifactor longoviformis]POP34789.1 hypothetical protein C3B58_01245 [Lactonifactor longoviformis]SHE73577.1 hypothetical protein SAMN02745158_01376 [Lactonifactor longoviformis DSM 17459]